MMRPIGVRAVFSHFNDLPDADRDATTGFPHDCAIRSDDPAALPPVDAAAPASGRGCDLRVKELVISPKGLRLVWLAEEADRGRYLIFRDAEMGQAPAAPDRLLAAAVGAARFAGGFLRDHERN